MIPKPIVYSAEERELIDAAIAAPDFGAAAWGAEKIADIRKRVKRYYIQVQAYRCCYCSQTVYAEHGWAWDIEHVIARSINARFMFEPCNLAISCIECNQAKSVTPVTNPKRVRFPKRSENYAIVHPHYDEWSEHIELEGDVTYRAITEKGKFTIYHCDLFRFWQRKAKIERPIRDRRFERDIGELRFAKSPEEAEPIVASILSRLEIEQRRTLDKADDGDTD